MAHPMRPRAVLVTSGGAEPKLDANGCPIPTGIQGQAEWDFEQPEINPPFFVGELG